MNPFTFILLIFLTFSQDILFLLTSLKEQKHVTEAVLRVGVAPMIFFSISNLVANHLAIHPTGKQGRVGGWEAEDAQGKGRCRSCEGNCQAVENGGGKGQVERSESTRGNQG